MKQLQPRRLLPGDVIRPLLAAAALTLAGTAGLHAQALGARIAAGPVYAATSGVAALAAVDLRGERLIARLEGRGTLTGRSRDFVRAARVLAAGAAAGVAFGGDRSGTYALATLGTGLDPRENDKLLSFGGALGAQLSRDNRGIFLELRYERWEQRGVVHHTLPDYAFGILVGWSL